MKKLIAVLLTVVMMMGAALAEAPSPSMPVLKPTEIRNEQGEVLDAPTLVVEVVHHEEVKEVTTAAVATVQKKAQEITQIFANIMPAIPAMPVISGAVAVVPEVAPEAVTEVVGEAAPAAPATVAEVKKQVEEAYVQVFGEKAVEALKEVIVLKEMKAMVEAGVLPETATLTEAAEAISEPAVAVGSLTIDEIAPLYIGGYEEHMGEVHIVVESVTQYKDDDVLVAMIGVVMTEEEIAAALANGELTEEDIVAGEPVIKWIALDAAVEEGNVVIAFTEEAMKTADGKENIVVLMRANEMEEAVEEEAAAE